MNSGIITIAKKLKIIFENNNNVTVKINDITSSDTNRSLNLIASDFNLQTTTGSISLKNLQSESDNTTSLLKIYDENLQLLIEKQQKEIIDKNNVIEEMSNSIVNIYKKLESLQKQLDDLHANSIITWDDEMN